ncbi:Radical SAM domain protein [Magnetococcus marinus MC-1]|uniref:Radical SAM domain protein n=1 Tax=Magnetococcus marinus (strain ATCC BAA-1437 / JCM 17883 / MC-1) TaxID=156889 RepID=A0L619_MAGMM|nr:AmmeMemoRadiSam system radical SAM enzyme [Magnetococcus marinus]ABK43412.1 Radical SAM domain protein [Magnetococcus marinus MC-1]
MQPAAPPYVGRYWQWHTDGRMACLLCPRRCLLQEGQRGLCFVRRRVGEQMILETYGRSSGFCVDPVEKKPLNHFLPGTPILSFGTAGCNLTCKFCQNWHMSKSKQMDALADQASPEMIAQAAVATQSRSVAYTYNDPVIFLEYAVDVAQACKAHGVRSVAVTAGYIEPEPAEAFFRHMDAANVDLKAFTERFYHKLCGGHLEAVKETLIYLKHHTDVWFELTTLLIPNENDSEAELHEMTQWVVATLGAEVPMHFTAFHPDFRMRNQSPTPAHTLSRARAIALANGVRYAYTGNVSDAAGGSSYCHHCGMQLITRNRYVISHWGLDAQGKCPRCATPMAGRFEAKPGQWGAKRLPIRFQSQ